MPTASRTPAKRPTRKTYKSRVPRSVKQRTFNIKRTFDAGNIASQPSSPNFTLGSFQCALSQLPGYTEFTNLFDQYRINKVRIDFIPCATQNGLNTTFNLFHMCVDHTDVTAPTVPSDVYQYDNHRTVRPYQPFSLTYKPAIAATYWQGTTASGYGPKSGAWVDSKSPGCAHYGCKYAWECNSSTVTWICTRVTMWCEFREPV